MRSCFRGRPGKPPRRLVDLNPKMRLPSVRSSKDQGEMRVPDTISADRGNVLNLVTSGIFASPSGRILVDTHPCRDDRFSRDLP